MFWEKLENNSIWKKFMDFQESSVKEEQTETLDNEESEDKSSDDWFEE